MLSSEIERSASVVGSASAASSAFAVASSVSLSTSCLELVQMSLVLNLLGTFDLRLEQ